ncbi:Spore coat polysaccharide biosynthesis protein SpsF, cytidylyltransferase family [Nostoc flagelliforme CCNUN1]|uniref:Spore coat polysaccharide biosynthesis protein SpsF, cytidylyltransferase family n=1 Tax=Nostoc flagelliforme CCNUN1 TaxID=2038116 RepID=A0A2K8SJV3_9NOSO|nr:transposase [Nostoc flagelliforme]AUB35115.1 Spore coat polysaccharide biosynthesis protein SpsF, cytidylyltransferase family [Nostoc flagelliforme CCNUN1]
MNRPATRSLSKQFRFEQPKSPPVVVNFNRGLVTSDAGLNLIAEIDRKLQITSQFAQCFQDYRKPYRIDHSIENLIRQRIYGLVMGYEDLNDHEELRHAPMFAHAA